MKILFNFVTFFFNQNVDLLAKINYLTWIIKYSKYKTILGILWGREPTCIVWEDVSNLNKITITFINNSKY